MLLIINYDTNYKNCVLNNIYVGSAIAMFVTSQHHVSNGLKYSPFSSIVKPFLMFRFGEILGMQQRGNMTKHLIKFYQFKLSYVMSDENTPSVFKSLLY